METTLQILFLERSRLSSLKDPSGRVTIPGFYDGIELDKKTLKILDEVPDDEEKMMNDMQFKEPDNVGKIIKNQFSIHL